MTNENMSQQPYHNEVGVSKVERVDTIEETGIDVTVMLPTVSPIGVPGWTDKKLKFTLETAETLAHLLLEALKPGSGFLTEYQLRLRNAYTAPKG
jgi:hypothetical protein